MVNHLFPAAGKTANENRNTLAELLFNIFQIQHYHEGYDAYRDKGNATHGGTIAPYNLQY